jgi:serine/threonine protein kinase
LNGIRTGDRISASQEQNMPGLSKTRWDAVSPYLDRALEMAPDARTTWIAGLRAEDPTLASDLEALLDERSQASREGFLEGAAAPPVGVSASLAGQAIGAYTLVSPIGQGGMGTVWRAQRSDGRFEGMVAVKLLNAEWIGRTGEERFKREGSILARLTHTHIAHLLDAGLSSAGQPYLVLEHIEGEPIDRYCARERLSVEARVRLFLDVLAAVAHAHANLIVHRDIKPSNVLVRTDGHVKLLDFGIAKLLEGEAGSGEPSALTREGGRALTPEYAAPEQVTGDTITTATDVYALGVLLYVLLSGRHPAGDARRSPADLVKAIVETEPPRLSAVTTDRVQRALRGDLDTIVAKALKKKPEERYTSVTALAEDLRRHLDHQPIGARPDTLGYRTARFVRRNRLSVALAALVLIALLAGLAGTMWQAREAKRQRDLALAQLVRAAGINEFTTYLMGDAVPVGKPVTMHELLTLSEQLVDKRFASDEPLAVELLIMIGGIYNALDESDNAQRTMKRAYEASRRLDDPAVRAAAACGWALTVARTGDYKEARRLVDTSLATLSDDPQFDGVAAGCLTYKSHVAAMEGDSQGAVQSAESSIARLDAMPGAFPQTRVVTLAVLAIGYHRRGEHGRADRAFEATLQQLGQLGRADSTQAATLLNNWALVRQTADVLSALALHRRAIQQNEGSGAPIPAIILANEGRLLNQLARYEEARRVLEAGRDTARRHNNRQALGLAAQALVRADRSLGDLAAAEKALAEAEEAASAFPATHAFRAELSREQGMLAMARGRDDDARRLLTAALQFHQKAARPSIPYIETLLDLTELDRRSERSAPAEEFARAALEMSEKLRDGRPHSAWVGRSQLALAEVLRARGDSAGARRLLGEAVAHLTPTLGEAHPAVQEARARLAEPL